MKRKNYINESLTNEEIKYIRKIIWNTAKKCVRGSHKKSKLVVFPISDSDFEKDLGYEDEYLFIDRKILEEYTDSEVKLKPYKKAERNRIVKTLDSLASHYDLYKYIKQLSFNEKLVIFLLYLKQFNVKETAKLLKVSEKTVYYYHNKARKTMKGIIKNEKRVI